MKTLKFLTLAGLSILMVACAPKRQLAQSRPENVEETMSNSAPLESGSYYIVNAGGLALTPWNAGAGENVFLQPFNHGGMQQWRVTKTPNTNTYSIKLAGSDAMFFQPNYVKDHTPMVSPGKTGASFRIQAATGSPDLWLIKSLKYNGDAMHSFVFSPNLPTEMRFDPSDGSRRFMWRFIKVKE